MSIYNMDFYRRERRAHWLKKVVAWIGVMAAGSLLVFGAGVTLLHYGMLDFIVTFSIGGLLAWGLWGFVFLKTRH
jgi:hypothetical protein